jgi:UDP-N-acetyl-D-glucosamine/UDP-N-acetyl-D-galactosamine dehydrogenase
MNNIEICVIGLGYVGLPLAVEFGKKRKVIGYDLNDQRISELMMGEDKTLEVSLEQLKTANHLTFTTNVDDIKNCEIYIITVPTPINNNNEPDLLPLKKATETVGRLLKENDIVIYESTVFPGATEEICVPILEKCSQLKFNRDFYCGYSPERINPGDKKHTLTSIKKITSGSTVKIAKKIDKLYNEIITAGTYRAESIKVAEAAKVIENTQRDVNIALINELSLIFNKLNIDTESVLKAAETKWNFLPFKPGLVGGHCIGVDPYYLTYKAIEVGYHPEMILAGRKLNNEMGIHIVNEVTKLMVSKNISLDDADVLIMGFSFKENCPDIRNTRVIDLVLEFDKLECNVDVYDPWIDKKDTFNVYAIKPIDKPVSKKYDAIILAVAHKEFLSFSNKDLRGFGKDNHVIYDIKYLLKSNESDGRL